LIEATRSVVFRLRPKYVESLDGKKPEEFSPAFVGDATAGRMLPAAGDIFGLLVALDIGSFAISGKTVTDHGISAVAQEDCALLRVFDGGVCRPYEDYEDDVSLAALEPLAPRGSASRAHRAQQDSSKRTMIGRPAFHPFIEPPPRS
jgi:hypothetical protein